MNHQETTETKPLTNAAYGRAVMGLLASPKESEKGITAMLKSRKSIQLSHAIAGIGTEVGELLEAMQPFILGGQLTEEVRFKFRDESGDLFFYLHVVARVLGLKNIPRSTQKINVYKLKGTILERLMDINALGTRITSTHKKLYYGMELNDVKIAQYVGQMLEVLTELTWQVLGHAPAKTYTFNLTKLNERFSGGPFNVAAIHAKDAKAERTH